LCMPTSLLNISVAIFTITTGERRRTCPRYKDLMEAALWIRAAE
jgi:hypothetical protein